MIAAFQRDPLLALWFHRAGALGNVEPRYVDYEGNDPISFVTDLNIDRRDLTNNQRAIVGAKLANLRHGGDRKSQEIKSPPGDLIKGKKEATRKEAAEKIRTSPRSIDRAKVILAADNAELLAAASLLLCVAEPELVEVERDPNAKAN